MPVNLPPGPNDADPTALLYAMRRDSIGFFTKLAAEYGDIAQFRLNSQNSYYLLNHPDLIREVLMSQDRNFTKWFAVDRIKDVLGDGLFVSEGETHFCQRRLVQPAFHRERITAYTEVMVQLAVELAESWRNDDVVDVCREMNTLAMSVVMKTLFGTEVGAEADEIAGALSQILDQFERSILPEAERAEFESACQRLDAVIYRLIEERRKSADDRGDLLSLLLAARDPEGHGGNLTNLQVRDEAMTIFLAGHETTANALAWTWHLLASHPEVEERFHAEVDRVLAGRRPTFEDVPRLTYTTMVFSEALRLYPPVWVIGRRAIADCTIGGYDVPADSIVILCQYLSHRDPRFFAEPARFDPERWTPEAKAARPKFSYFPFSGGSRSCLGESFAWAEAVLSLATLAQRFRLRMVPGHRVALQPQLTLRAKYGLKMRLEKRAEPGGKIDSSHVAS